MSLRHLKLLVLDDDELIHQSIKLSLQSPWTMMSLRSFDEIPAQTFQAAFVDMHLSGKLSKTEGLAAIKSLHEKDPHLEIVAISGNLSQELMEASLKAGASRFLAKPLSTDEIQHVLEKIEALFLLREAQQRQADSPQWLGQSSASEKIRKEIAQLKGERGPILIEGESGAGKEVIARLLHNLESEGALVQVNMAAITENLFESELFGHTKGAFTGAEQNKMGLAEAAHKGDLFLDEIEALPLSSQAKLLRFLESGEIKRVGSKDTLKVKVRVIAATNQNLEKMVREGKFREDLMWRLNGKKILVPPLRERKEDIEVLARTFLELDKPRRNKTLHQEALTLLQEYQWPGNVRELKRVIEQLSLISPLPIIRAEDVRRSIQPIEQTIAGDSVDLTKGLNNLLMDFEKQLIIKALKSKVDIDETAKLLDISRSSLYKKINDYDIEMPR